MEEVRRQRDDFAHILSSCDVFRHPEIVPSRHEGPSLKPIILVGTLVIVLLMAVAAAGVVTLRPTQTSSTVTSTSSTSSQSSSQSTRSAAATSSVSTIRTSSTSTTTSTTRPSQSIAITNVMVTIVRGAFSNTSSWGYSPGVVIVFIGVNNTVTWRNYDTVVHTVSSATEGFSSSMDLRPGESYTFTFATPGTYIYSCAYHGWMNGTVIVKGTP